MCVQRAGYAKHRGSHREGFDLEHQHVLAGDRGDVLIIAYRSQHASEGSHAQTVQQCEYEATRTSTTIVRNNRLNCNGEIVPRHGPGMPAMPSDPLVSQISLLAAIRIDSEKPKVTIAR
jgi:hypothetical protein